MTNHHQDERTPLHWAASSGSLEITQFLINQGAEVDKLDGAGWTPLHIAGKIIDDLRENLLKDRVTAK